ncbi:MAG: hypothetical protein ABJA16_09465 [Nakamurella sp.]
MIDRAHTALTRLTLTLLAVLSSLHVHTSEERTDDHRDRGDVPGWVMITLMTAIVVVGLLAVFRGQVTEAVRSAFNSIQ